MLKSKDCEINFELFNQCCKCLLLHSLLSDDVCNLRFMYSFDYSLYRIESNHLWNMGIP